MSDPEIETLTREAASILENVHLKNFFTKISSMKFFCSCLGSSKDNEILYEYRKICLDTLNGMEHDAFFPESVTDVFLKKLMEKGNLPQETRKIVLENVNLRNEFMILESDLIFIIPASPGAASEFNKYIERVPRKVRVLVPINSMPEGKQTNLDIETFRRKFPNSVIEFKDTEELEDRLKRCIEFEKQIRLGEDLADGK